MSKAEIQNFYKNNKLMSQDIKSNLPDEDIRLIKKFEKYISNHMKTKEYETVGYYYYKIGLMTSDLDYYENAIRYYNKSGNKEMVNKLNIEGMSLLVDNYYEPKKSTVIILSVFLLGLIMICS